MLSYAQERQRNAVQIWKYTGPAEGLARTLPPLSLTTEETDEYNYIMGDIGTYAGEMNLKFILGTESLDNLPTFVETLKGMDIDKAIAIQQDAYNRYLAR